MFAPKRSKGQFTAQRGNLQSNLAVASGRHVIGTQGPVGDLNAESISGRTVEPIARPSYGRVLRRRAGGDFGGKRAPGLVIPHYPQTRQRRLLSTPVRRSVRDRLRRHSV